MAEDNSFERNRSLFGSVPPVSEDFVCHVCLGPVNRGFQSCFACGRLTSSQGLPRQLLGKVVPMTTATNPGPWYTRLATYKTVHPEYQIPLASLVYVYLSSNLREIESLLGGSWDIVTPVPSKRGVEYDEQPLRRALHRIGPLRDRLASTLVFDSESTLDRRQFGPEVFRIGPTPVRDQRVLLIEDLWVTGATALSAAGALLDHHARSVVLLPIARCIDAEFWAGHAYLEAMRSEYRPGAWPR